MPLLHTNNGPFDSRLSLLTQEQRRAVNAASDCLYFTASGENNSRSLSAVSLSKVRQNRRRVLLERGAGQSHPLFSSCVNTGDSNHSCRSPSGSDRPSRFGSALGLGRHAGCMLSSFSTALCVPPCTPALCNDSFYTQFHQPSKGWEQRICLPPSLSLARSHILVYLSHYHLFFSRCLRSLSLSLSRSQFQFNFRFSVLYWHDIKLYICITKAFEMRNGAM